MTELFVKILEHGYHFNEKGVKTIEEKYGAKYMGFWCTKNPRGGWNERPVDVFYQPNPNVELGHKHYFGMFVRDDTAFICDASSAFEEPMTGVVCEDGEVLVSRYRHDYRTKGDRMVDGGRDYVRRSLHPTATVTVNGPDFVVSAS